MGSEEEIKNVLELIAYWLAKINANNCMGFTDINKVAEDLASKLLNEIYDYQLVNLNYKKENYPGIDLGDEKNKIAFQITSKREVRKIKENLKTFAKGSHEIYSNGIRFLILSQEKTSNLKGKNYKDIYPVFDPAKHILTAKDLILAIKKIFIEDKDKFYRIKTLLEDELGRFSIPSIRPDSFKFYLGIFPKVGPDLIGRKRQLKILTDAWDNEKTNVVSITALGGVGKTALVKVWLNQMKLKNFEGADRIFCWSFYNQGTEEGTFVSEDIFILRALEWFGDPNPSHGSPWNKGERLAELIKKQRTLLILDGLEPLQYLPGSRGRQLNQIGLKFLLPNLALSNPGLCIITSRFEIEEIKDVREPSVKYINLPNLSQKAGSQILFAIGVNKGTEYERKRVSKEFGGHALALILLAGLLKALFKGDIRYWKEIGPLEDEEQEGKHARRVLEAYERYLEDKPELELLYLMGLFDRPAEYKAITTLRSSPVLFELTKKLHQIRDRDLRLIISRLKEIRLLNEPDLSQHDTLDTHPLIREHFREKLKKSNQGVWLAGHEILYNYYKSLAPKQPKTLEEMAPLYAAVSHGVKANFHQKTFNEIIYPKIQRGTKFFSSYNLGAYESDLSILSEFFLPSKEPWQKFVPNLKKETEAFISKETGYCLRALGRLNESIPLVKNAIQIYNSIKSLPEISDSFHILSRIYLALGELENALFHAKKSVEYSDLIGDLPRKINKRIVLGDVLHNMGKFVEAEIIFLESERLQKNEKKKNPRTRTILEFHYCDFLLTMGRFQEILDKASEIMDWNKQKEFPLSMALDQLVLGKAYLAKAKISDKNLFYLSKNYLDKAVDNFRLASYQEYLPIGLFGQVEINRLTGNFNKAQKTLDEAILIIKRGNMKLYEAEYYLTRAWLYISMSKKNDAFNSVNIAKEKINKMGYNRRLLEIENLERQLNF
jgi:tetratricopeptide (TPR) repeat protein